MAEFAACKQKAIYSAGRSDRQFASLEWIFVMICVYVAVEVGNNLFHIRPTRYKNVLCKIFFE